MKYALLIAPRMSSRWTVGLCLGPYGGPREGGGGSCERGTLVTRCEDIVFFITLDTGPCEGPSALS